MDLFAELSIRHHRRMKSRASRKAASKNSIQDVLVCRPMIESLEDRTVLSCNSISGHVYQDVNGNGLFDAGDVAIANSNLELKNDQGAIIATTKTDANGFYVFDHDPTINTSIMTKEQTVTIPSELAGFSLSRVVDQFDPSLGQLIEVEIINEGSITSEIRAENSATLAGATINGVVSGKITLTGPGGVNLIATVNQNAGSFTATKFDGTIDFAGTSGKQFSPVTATANPQTITLTGASLTPFIGTGQVSFTEDVEVNSSATGGGNLLIGIKSEATTKLTVRYKYKPKNCLKPGNYTITQTEQPFLPSGTDRYLDGKEFKNGTPVPNSVGTDVIAVTLSTSDVTNNDFTEVPHAGVGGFVYHDENNDGIKQTDLNGSGLPREPGIANVKITLTGTDDTGAAVNKEVRTGADGSYLFEKLRPGTYKLNEEQPAGFGDGKDTIGTPGGTTGNDEFSNIVLGPGVLGRNNNFGELKGGSLSGFVYQDFNDNGLKESGELGIDKVKVKLTGTTVTGQTITQETETRFDGFYRFSDLAPGTYSIEEVQPAAFVDGQDRIGTPGGTTTNDKFSNIVLQNGVHGENNNFGELTAASLSGYVYEDLNNDGFKQAGENGIGGVKVKLVGTGASGVVEKEITANPDGSYSFSNLEPGTYSLIETQPTTHADGRDTIGSQGGSVSNDRFDNIVLKSGVNGINNNFGERPLASLSGFVYEDLNDNGLKDPTEAGIGNVPVSLVKQDGAVLTVLQTVNTAGDGSYKFDDLQPGTYQIHEVRNPTGYADGKDTIGTQGGTTTNDRFTNVLLDAGTNGTDNNFGERIMGDVGVLKTALPTTVLAGGQVTYTLTVTNFGPSTAKDVRVVDSLPAGFTFLDVISVGWTVQNTGSQIVLTRDEMITGAVSTIQVVAQAPVSTGTYTNVVTVSSSTPDTNPNNNSDTAVVTVPSTPISPNPNPPGDEILTKAVILASSDFWLQLLR